MKWLEEFKEFLNEYKVIGLAIAFIIGTAATKLVSSLVNDVFMPIIGALLLQGDWRTSVLQIGSINIMIGSFLGALIDFTAIALMVFAIVKMFKIEKK